MAQCLQIKQIQVARVNDLGPTSKMTLTFKTHIYSFIQLVLGHRRQPFLKNPLFPGKKIFKAFLPDLGMAAILVMCPAL